MTARFRVRLRCLAGLALLLLQSCQDIQSNVPKTVWIKYAHIANVNQFQQDFQYRGVNNLSFWAVFEVCSIDIQGSALTGFNYDSRKFVIPWGTEAIGATTPGVVARSDSKALPLPNAEVTDVAHTALEVGPSSLYLPKQLYLKPGFRFAIFVNAYPAGYHGESMQLQYLGQPEVAAVVQDVSDLKPQEISFFNHTPGISGRCQ